MKLTDAIISAVLKKGVVYEARNFEADIDIPDSNMKINVKIDHMTIKLEKENEK